MSNFSSILRKVCIMSFRPKGEILIHLVDLTGLKFLPALEMTSVQVDAYSLHGFIENLQR